MLKRIFLFIAVNFLVVMTINITLTVLGVQPYLTANGIDYTSLLAFCAVVGFVGALFSLATSRIMAKMLMGVRVINPAQPGSQAHKDLLILVHRLAQKAGLPVMPEVGIYPSPEVNAFATGPSKSKSLVAVSEGLLNQMDSTAVEGVLAHEVAHIANGDMVTMTLVQGVVNTFVMFFARIAAWGVAQAMSGNRNNDENPSPMIHYFAVIAFEIIFSLLGAVVVAFYSRRREFRADAGGAMFASREKMIHALESLKATTGQFDDKTQAMAALKISGKSGGLMALLASHPDLDVRIAALRTGRA
ncbi:protease HtpX [bacterium]|nr:protease HtpX [bacterium]